MKQNCRVHNRSLTSRHKREVSASQTILACVDDPLNKSERCCCVPQVEENSAAGTEVGTIVIESDDPDRLYGCSMQNASAAPFAVVHIAPKLKWRIGVESFPDSRPMEL